MEVGISSLELTHQYRVTTTVVLVIFAFPVHLKSGLNRTEEWLRIEVSIDVPTSRICLVFVSLANLIAILLLNMVRVSILWSNVMGLAVFNRLRLLKQERLDCVAWQ